MVHLFIKIGFACYRSRCLCKGYAGTTEKEGWQRREERRKHGHRLNKKNDCQKTKWL